MIKLKDIKQKFPNARSTGNSEVIESIMPKYCKVFHIDSHNTSDGGYRFQGVVIDGNPAKQENASVFDTMPIEVLKQCKNYNIFNNIDHIVWTLWF